MLPIILVLLALGWANADVTCVISSFTTCQKNFNKALGIEEAYNWENPKALLSAIQNIYINDFTPVAGAPGVASTGLIAVCNAYTDLVKCITQAHTKPDDCFSAHWLLINDHIPDNAYQYAMLMKQVKWQCGAGFYPAFDNWDCIKRVYAGYNSSLTECIRSFRVNAADAAPDKKCAYAVMGKDCYKKPFFDTCHNGGAENYGCESFRQYVLAEYAQCEEFDKLFCKVRI